MQRKFKSALLIAFAAAVLTAQEPGAVRAAVWGQVARPGSFELAGTPDLLELVSAAGGPLPGADLTRLTLYRELDGSRRTLNVERLMAQGEPQFLVSGDVVYVPESFWSGVQRNLPVITTVATLVNLAVTITLLAR